MKLRTILAFFSLGTFGWAITLGIFKDFAIAQDREVSSTISETVEIQQSPISPTKRALITELLQLTSEVDEDTFVVSFHESQRLVEELIPDDHLMNLPQEERQEYQDSMGRVKKRLNERILSEIDFTGLLEETSYLLYDKYYTENDLKALIAFY